MTTSRKNKFYITTPIYYVTAAPHLGSLYSTIIADVAARWHQLQGNKVYMLTGTDEHGQKIAQAAARAGQEPQAFVDSFIPAYKSVWSQYNIHYSHFIRTTDAYHVKAVQEWIVKLMAQGDIYKGFYTGWYCTPCETFVSVESSSAAPLCPSCGRPTESASEESYFFRLSAYQDLLLQFYAQHPDFIAPRERLHEVIKFVQAGLTDLSISRSSVSWGIPFPGDPRHTVYVWADALNNYITAIGYGQKGREQEFAQWWPANAHVIGKDIVRFHAVYWPAFLMAAGLPLPQRLVVHGWITVDQQKMSKSLGNVVDPQRLSDLYGADPVRYYLMRYMPITHDSDFSLTDLERAITTDLANDLGNLLNRITQLAHKYMVHEVSAPATWSAEATELLDMCWRTIEEVASHMNSYNYHMALAAVWRCIAAINSYFHKAQPWVLAKVDMDHFQQVLSVSASALYKMAILLWPFMPHTMEQLLECLGTSVPKDKNSIELIATETWHSRFVLKATAAPLFKKYDMVKDTEPMKDTTASLPAQENYISIDDFAKVELVVGTITSCEIVPKSDKLYKLMVDFGEKGTRQILSGVRTHFKPEELLEKQAVFVFNLPPRTMMGFESQGMLLVAQDAHGKWHVVSTGIAIPNGSRLR